MILKTKPNRLYPQSVQYSPLYNFPHKRLRYYHSLDAFIPKSLFLQRRHSTKTVRMSSFRRVRYMVSLLGHADSVTLTR
jgi:hypothetical protein